MVKLLINELNLVYPPFSNQEGEWLWDDNEVREFVKNSKLYMIGHRKELKFNNARFLPVNFGEIAFELVLGEIISPTIRLCIKDIMNYLTESTNPIDFELGDKLIRIKDNATHDILYWATPDVFLYGYFKNRIHATIDAPFDLKVFWKFELYYIGISKENDSFSRLFEQSHHGRLKILSNETQKNKEARLTDELIMFLFDIEHFNINSIGHDEILDDAKFNQSINYYTNDDLLIIADAEKAFINLMDTKYNRVKYSDYPYSKDGLYNEDLDKYSFAINENVIFYTDGIEFVRAYGYDKPKDFILVNGDVADIIKCTS